MELIEVVLIMKTNTYNHVHVGETRAKNLPMDRVY